VMFDSNIDYEDANNSCLFKFFWNA
jgi:hypothetical protein